MIYHYKLSLCSPILPAWSARVKVLYREGQRDKAVHIASQMRPMIVCKTDSDDEC